MKRTGKLAQAFALAVGLIVADSAAASPRNNPQRTDSPSAHLTIGPGIFRPLGAHSYCRRLPAECQPHAAAAPRRVIWNKDSRLLLDRINRTYNNNITYRYDHHQYGVKDYWAHPTSGYGDCEDYAIAKKAALIAAGWPPASLLLATVISETGDGHAVLVARSNKGDFVLDNRYDDVMIWHDLPYKWLAIQSPDHAGNWRNLHDFSTMPNMGSFTPFAPENRPSGQEQAVLPEKKPALF